MDGDVVQIERTEEWGEDEGLGTTRTLTESGWEVSDYLDPGDDWGRMPDGSYLSPDGLTRTWPPTAD